MPGDETITPFGCLDLFFFSQVHVEVSRKALW